MRSDAESNMFAIIDLMQRPRGASIQEICDTLGCDRHTFYVQGIQTPNAGTSRRNGPIRRRSCSSPGTG